MGPERRGSGKAHARRAARARLKQALPAPAPPAQHALFAPHSSIPSKGSTAPLSMESPSGYTRACSGSPTPPAGGAAPHPATRSRPLSRALQRILVAARAPLFTASSTLSSPGAARSVNGWVSRSNSSLHAAPPAAAQRMEGPTSARQTRPTHCDSAPPASPTAARRRARPARPAAGPITWKRRRSRARPPPPWPRAPRRAARRAAPRRSAHLSSVGLAPPAALRRRALPARRRPGACSRPAATRPAARPGATPAAARGQGLGQGRREPSGQGRDSRPGRTRRRRLPGLRACRRRRRRAWAREQPARYARLAARALGRPRRRRARAARASAQSTAAGVRARGRRAPAPRGTWHWQFVTYCSIRLTSPHGPLALHTARMTGSPGRSRVLRQRGPRARTGRSAKCRR